MVNLIVYLILLAIAASLGLALFSLLKAKSDNADRAKIVKALTLRIGLSIFLFVFLIRSGFEIFLARRIIGISGELSELIDRIADIAADDHLDILVLPLPARPAEDENEAERHEQP